MARPAKAELIPPEAYPQLLPRALAASLARSLRSPEAARQADVIFKESAAELRDAVCADATLLENAGQDHVLVSEKAHEIRSLAETAGMRSTGRIADGLCRYFDDSAQLGVAPDADVVALHVSAIIRTARDTDAGSQMSDSVARGLAALANRKLAELRQC